MFFSAYRKAWSPLFVLFSGVASCGIIVGSIVLGEVRTNIAITRMMIQMFLATEHFLVTNLQCATEALNLYMLHNSFPMTERILKPLAKRVGVTGYNMFDATGRRVYASNGGCPYSNVQGCTFRTTEAHPSLKRIMTGKASHKTFPIAFEKGVTASAGFKFDMMWMPSKRLFLDAYINTSDFASLFEKIVLANKTVSEMSVSTPTGIILLSSEKSKEEAKLRKLRYFRKDISQDAIAVGEYTEKPFINYSYGKYTVSIPFGGLLDSEGYTQKGPGSDLYKGQANSKDQYFYVMNVTFRSEKLVKQIVIVCLSFMCFVFFVLSVRRLSSKK